MASVWKFSIQMFVDKLQHRKRLHPSWHASELVGGFSDVLELNRITEFNRSTIDEPDQALRSQIGYLSADGFDRESKIIGYLGSCQRQIQDWAM